MADTTLTKADTVALWHVVQWMVLCLRQPYDGQPEPMENERAKLASAKRALRKVNAIRKAALSSPVADGGGK